MPSIVISELVFDVSLYPRKTPSTVHISELADAIQAGAVLPAIVVEDGKNRIVDGVHRVNAYKKVYGDQHEIEVEMRTFDSEAELFLESIRLNSGHGLGLTTYDRSRCLIRCEELGITREQISGAFGMPLAKVQKISFSRTAFVKSNDHQHSTAIKGAMRPLRQKVLTSEQIGANEYVGGLSATYYVNSVIKLVEAGVLDWGTGGVREDLVRLHALLSEKFKV